MKNICVCCQQITQLISDETVLLFILKYHDDDHRRFFKKLRDEKHLFV